VCNGRFLLRDRQLLTIDEAAAQKEAAAVAAKIDEFVAQRESNPYHKLVLLSAITRQESFEIQVKVPLAEAATVRRVITNDIEITKYTHYRQYDHYFYFDGDDPEAARLRYREDEFVNEKGEAYQERTRLTLIGEAERQEFAHAIMLSRSRYLADADRSLRFYREYFAPARQVEVHKDRWRWRVIYQDTEFAINLDQLTRPELPGYYLEIKARTWSRQDAEKKAALVIVLLRKLGLDVETAERREYFDLV
jgi:5-methylthioadenosine/S-adenosylhomocysteine deaminase